MKLGRQQVFRLQLNVHKKNTALGGDNTVGLTVLLGGHLESHVLLLELLVGLLQVADVVDGFAQHRRLVELERDRHE